MPNHCSQSHPGRTLFSACGAVFWLPELQNRKIVTGSIAFWFYLTRAQLFVTQRWIGTRYSWLFKSDSIMTMHVRQFLSLQPPASRALVDLGRSCSGNCAPFCLLLSPFLTSWLPACRHASNILLSPTEWRTLFLDANKLLKMDMWGASIFNVDLNISLSLAWSSVSWNRFISFLNTNYTL